MNRSMRSQSGFSLIELVIASSLLGLLVMAVSTLAVSGGQAQDFTRRLSRATEVTQDIVDQMRLEMVSSVRVFGDDAEGRANLDILNLDGAPKGLGTSRLPLVSPNNTVARDSAGNKITGNSLFFTRLAWSDRFVCASGKEYLIDVPLDLLLPDAGRRRAQGWQPIGLEPGASGLRAADRRRRCGRHRRCRGPGGSAAAPARGHGRRQRRGACPGPARLVARGLAVRPRHDPPDHQHQRQAQRRPDRRARRPLADPASQFRGRRTAQLPTPLGRLHLLAAGLRGRSGTG